MGRSVRVLFLASVCLNHFASMSHASPTFLRSHFTFPYSACSCFWHVGADILSYCMPFYCILHVYSILHVFTGGRGVCVAGHRARRLPGPAVQVEAKQRPWFGERGCGVSLDGPQWEQETQHRGKKRLLYRLFVAVFVLSCSLVCLLTLTGVFMIFETPICLPSFTCLSPFVSTHPFSCLIIDYGRCG